jgi:hypothetical protein
MADGQYAGLCLMADPAQLIGVAMQNGRKRIRYQYASYNLTTPGWRENPRDNEIPLGYSDDFFCADSDEVNQDEIFFRLEHTLNQATLSFSLDGKTFSAPFETLTFDFCAWRGGRVGFFCWNEFKEAGTADFDYLSYDAGIKNGKK